MGISTVADETIDRILNEKDEEDEEEEQEDSEE